MMLDFKGSPALREMDFMVNEVQRGTTSPSVPELSTRQGFNTLSYRGST